MTTLLLAAVITAVATPAGAAPHGGNGGAPFTSDCGADGVMVAVKTRTGTLVDSVQPVCVKVYGNGQWASDYFEAAKAGGEGGASGSLYCNEGAAVKGISGRADTLVHQLKVHCGKMGATGGQVKVVSDAGTRGPLGGGGGTAFSEDVCPSGQVARGFRGRSGALIDQIELVCHVPTVQPPIVSSVTMSTARLIGTGTTSVGGTVTLNAAPASDLKVPMSSSDSTAASVFGEMTVAAGSTTGTFTVSPRVVTEVKTVTITAGPSGKTKSTTVTVEPLGVGSVTIGLAEFGGGRDMSAKVLTNDRVLADAGLTVPLSSSHPSIAAVPATITVPRYLSEQPFTVTTTPVTSPTVVTITAGQAGQGAGAKTVSFTVKPPAISSFSVSHPNVYRGESSTKTGRVLLDGKAGSGGLVVTVASSNPAFVSTPATYTVPAGQSQGEFVCQVNPFDVATDTPVTLTATVGSVSKTATMTLKAPGIHQVSVSGSQGQVTLGSAAPAAGGMTVALSSSNTAALTVPGSVAIPGGQQGATFQVTRQPVSAETSVTVTAGQGSGAKTTTVVLRPPYASQLSLGSTSVKGGVNVTGTVTLSENAPSGGLSVSLFTSDSTTATVPTSVTVAAGQKTATFTITTKTVTASKSVTVSGQGGGQSAGAVLTVTK